MLRFAPDAFTFDDVLLRPDHSVLLAADTDLSTHLTRDIAMPLPLLSAAMDTITDAALAIALAREGGIGAVHRNMDIAAQAAAVRTVKKHESWVVRDPITIQAGASVADLVALCAEHRISSVPVQEGAALVGIITHRDICYVSADSPSAVRDWMTPKSRLVTVTDPDDIDGIKRLLRDRRIEKVLVVDDRFALCGMVTARDIDTVQRLPNACKDSSGQLRVAAAVGVVDTEERVPELLDAGVDVLVVDTAHGHSRNVIDRVRWIKRHHPDAPLLAGNIATAEAALALAEAGADAVKVGIGPGSICTTRIVTGVGVPQLSAVAEVAHALRGTDVKVVADGGIRYSGDIAKAIVAGAHAVMLGNMFAGTEEAPGATELYEGRRYKIYQGMGSLGAMVDGVGAAERYGQRADSGKLVPEGIEGRVPYKGSVSGVAAQLAGGLRASMGYTGCADIDTMRSKPKFIRVTPSSMQESHVHDVSITKEAPNYPRL